MTRFWGWLRPYLGAVCFFTGIGALFYGWLHQHDLQDWLFGWAFGCEGNCSPAPLLWMALGFGLLVLAFKSGAIRKDVVDALKDDEHS